MLLNWHAHAPPATQQRLDVVVAAGGSAGTGSIGWSETGRRVDHLVSTRCLMPQWAVPSNPETERAKAPRESADWLPVQLWLRQF